VTEERRLKSEKDKPKREPFQGMDAVKARQQANDLVQRRAVYAIKSTIDFTDPSSLEVLVRNVYEYQMDDRYVFRQELKEQLRAFISFVRGQPFLLSIDELRRRNELRSIVLLSESEFQKWLNSSTIETVITVSDYIRDTLHSSKKFQQYLYGVVDPRFFDYLGCCTSYSSFQDYLNRSAKK
jgi:hypothetical protein